MQRITPNQTRLLILLYNQCPTTPIKRLAMLTSMSVATAYRLVNKAGLRNSKPHFIVTAQDVLYLRQADMTYREVASVLNISATHAWRLDHQHG